MQYRLFHVSTINVVKMRGRIEMKMKMYAVGICARSYESRKQIDCAINDLRDMRKYWSFITVYCY